MCIGICLKQKVPMFYSCKRIWTFKDNWIDLFNSPILPFWLVQRPFLLHNQQMPNNMNSKGATYRRNSSIQVRTSIDLDSTFPQFIAPNCQSLIVNQNKLFNVKLIFHYSLKSRKMNLQISIFFFLLNLSNLKKNEKPS